MFKANRWRRGRLFSGVVTWLGGVTLSQLRDCVQDRVIPAAQMPNNLSINVVVREVQSGSSMPRPAALTFSFHSRPLPVKSAEGRDKHSCQVHRQVQPGWQDDCEQQLEASKSCIRHTHGERRLENAVRAE